jgi:hypothetical protein
MDRKNTIVPKTVESQPNVAEPSVKEAFDGMAQQLAVLTAEVFHVKTVLSNGVEYLKTCADQEPSLSAAEYMREQDKTRILMTLYFMVIVVLMCLFHMREAAMTQPSPPSIWETILRHMADFPLTDEESPPIWCL